MDSINRNIYKHIENLQLYSKDLVLTEAVEKSNHKFKKLNDVQRYIDNKDRRWVSAPAHSTPAFMKKLIDSYLANELKEKIEFYKKNYGYLVLGEIFVTNKFGANVAQTGRTTDYKQSDELWWQSAKKEGVFVGDVQYDESAAVYSNDIAVRLEDENGNFAGVIKAVLNIEEAINIIKHAEKTTENGTLKFKLCTKDYRIIYATEDFEFLAKVPEEMLHEHNRHIGKSLNFEIARNKHGKEKLLSHVNSTGYKDFDGLGWNFIVEHEIKEFFAPIADLNNHIIIISGLITILAILMGVLISAAIAKPVLKLSAASKQIGEGNLDVQIDIESKDEMGQLAASFAKMRDNLKANIGELNKEASDRLRAEQELVNQNEFLYNILESLTHPFYVIDANDYTIKMANSAAHEKILPGEVTCYEIYHKRSEPCEGDNTPCPLKEIKKTGKPVAVEHIRYDKEGNLRNVEVHAYPVFDEDGNISQIIEYALDITERKQAEDALKKAMGELQRFNKLAVGRELKMVELKDEINELLVQIGKEQKYKTTIKSL